MIYKNINNDEKNTVVMTTTDVIDHNNAKII